MEKTALQRLDRAVGVFIRKLFEVPGWREARAASLMRTLDLDGDRLDAPEPEAVELSPEMELQHAVVGAYLEVQDVVQSVKTCEYYFRRFPFRGLPVTLQEHLSNACELYFNRIYQFKERLKNLVDAVDALVPNHRLDFGKFIKDFSREFGQEIRERNQIHHSEKFVDLEIERVFLLGVRDETFRKRGLKAQQQRHYRKVAREWANRVRRRSAQLDVFHEALADGLLRTCPFLAEAERTGTL